MKRRRKRRRKRRSCFTGHLIVKVGKRKIIFSHLFLPTSAAREEEEGEKEDMNCVLTLLL